MAIYPGAVLKLIPPDANDPKQTQRAAVLHVDAGNAYSLYSLFLGNQKPGGSKIEAHFFVKTNGVVEQYRDTDYQADAAYASNDFAIQIETQGYGAGTWTPAQLAAIKKLLLWINAKHPVPMVKIASYDGTGVGYHCQFPEWNRSNHSCPGPDRVKQFETALVPWMKVVSTPLPKPQPAPVKDTQVSIGRAKILDGLAYLDKAGQHGRRYVAFVAKGIRALVNKLPER